MPIIGTGIFGFGEFHFHFIFNENTILFLFQGWWRLCKHVHWCMVDMLTNTVLLFNVVIACLFNFTWLTHSRMPRVPLQQQLYVFIFGIETPVGWWRLWIRDQLFRSLLGFAFPLFGAQMYRALGQGGGNSVRLSHSLEQYWRFLLSPHSCWLGLRLWLVAHSRSGYTTGVRKCVQGTRLHRLLWNLKSFCKLQMKRSRHSHSAYIWSSSCVSSIGHATNA